VLKPASAPPRSYGNRFQLAEGASPRGLTAAQLPICLSTAAAAAFRSLRVRDGQEQNSSNAKKLESLI
jgi:hypothetical protein